MKTIYRPKGRALEYSFLALNHYVGCDHGCGYCYAEKMAHQFGTDFTGEQKLRKGFVEQLRKDAPKYAGTTDRVLLCFMCDPYQTIDDELKATREVLTILRKHNIPFQVLTKGGRRAVKDFDLYSANDAFATTLTFCKLDKSLEYEPRAAAPASRITAIAEAKDRGIQTWVSLEPVIDPAESLSLIEITHNYVDLYKIGKMNHERNETDWRRFGLEAIELCEKVGAQYYIKHDLAEYLKEDVRLRGMFYKSIDTRSVP